MTAIEPSLAALDFSSNRLCELSGASYRQVNYWAVKGYLTPLDRGPKAGRQQRFDIRAVLAARAVVKLQKHLTPHKRSGNLPGAVMEAVLGARIEGLLGRMVVQIEAVTIIMDCSLSRDDDPSLIASVMAWADKES